VPNNTSIWKRLNTTRVILIALLFVASGLAWWIERTRSEGQHISDRLARDNATLQYQFLEMSDALRALKDDPRSRLDKQRLEVAERNLKDLLDDLLKRPDLANDPALAKPLKALDAFAQYTLLPFQRTVQTQLTTDPVTARENFAKSEAEFARQRNELLRELTRATFDQSQQALTRSQYNAVIASGGMLLILGIAIAVMRRQSAAVTIPLAALVTAIERMRNGDFTQRLQLPHRDEFGLLAEGLNRLADDLTKLVSQVQHSGVQVNITATQIAATTKEQQSTTTEIAATTAEIGATSKQISATSKELDKTMNELGEVAADTAELAGSGQSGIARMDATMRRILDASGAITTRLAVLSDKTGNITTVVTTITKVADQTNLLSLNAAIEAEKAGEYGLGFAVVAMEIRRLADQTAVATYDIEKTVKEMQTAVTAGVMGMDKFGEEVRRGVEEIRQISGLLAQIIEQVQHLTPRFATVSEGMHAQATGATQISETLIQLSEAAQQTADSLRHSTLAIEQLNDAARGLQTGVARFKLEAGEKQN
jgi:methyl-accepting chemotaxis protein